MVTLAYSAPSAGSTILPRSRSFVRVAQSWSDEWEYVPYLRPRKSTSAAAPEVGCAELLYQVGPIKREDTTTFATYTPQELIDWYCQIMIQYPGQRPQASWTGIISDGSIAIDRPGTLAGPQQIRAYGLGHLLDREPIRQAKVGYGVTESSTLKTIDWVPTINEKWRRGKTLRGNRSAELGPDGVYVYDEKVGETEEWTHKTYLEYALQYFAPPEITWELAGDTDSLDQLTGIYDVERKTLWQLLNQLIDRRHGLGFYVTQAGENSDTVLIWVYSLIETDVSYGSATLTANPDQVYFTMPSTFPYSHQVGEIPYRVTACGKYDRLIVDGERWLVCGTFGKQEETGDRAWPETLETAYRTGSGTSGTDVDANVRLRAQEQYKGVFSSFAVPRDWDGKVGDGEGGDKHPLMFARTAAGINANAVGDFWAGAKRFEKQLPLREGWDYSQADGTIDNNDAEREPGFLPLAAFIRDSANGARHLADNKWHRLDRLAEDYRNTAADGIKSLHLTPADHELGIKLDVSPRHYLALNHWTSAGPDPSPPEFDWEQMIWTGAIRHDRRSTVQLDLFDGEPFEGMRTLHVHVAGVEYWRAALGTVYDVDAVGGLRRIHENNVVIRDDTEKLHAYVAFLAAWFGTERQAVQIPLRALGLFVPLGTLLTGIANAAQWVPVNTVVTARVIDYVRRTTTIETSYSAHDMILPQLDVTAEATRPTGSAAASSAAAVDLWTGGDTTDVGAIA